MKRLINNFLKNENNLLFYTVVLSLVLFSIIPSLRILFHDSIMVGDISYYHIRIADYLRSNQIPDKDPLTGSPYTLNPYHLLLAKTSLLFGLYWSSILIPFFLGMSSSILLYLILKKLGINKFTRFLIITIFIFSPLSLYTFSTSNAYALPLTLFMAGFYFFIQEKKHYMPLSVIFFSSLSFFDFEIILFSSLIIISYLFYKRDFVLKSVLSLLFIIIIAAINKKFEISQLNISSLSLTNIVSDLGAYYGFGVFNIFLAFIGLYIVWRMKKYILPYLLLLFIVVLSLYFNPLVLYLNLIFAILSGYSLTAFVVLNWRLQPIKFLTILIIACGLLFSAVSYLNRISNELPDKDIVKAMEWLKDNSQDNKIVFSSGKNTDWINTIANRQTVIIHQNKNRSLIEQANELFQSRNLEKTKGIMKGCNISYILITKEMRNGGVWVKEDQGLLFLFRNKREFRQVYYNQGAEIWDVLK